MNLKRYQQNTLDTLGEFLRELKKVGPRYAFMGITEKPYKVESFDEVPFICIKIPTGGGKTLVAGHSVVKVMNEALQHKLGRGIVIWFVPSEAIKTQTLRFMKDKKSPLRGVLDEAFENGVKVFSNEEALSIRKEDVNDNICIIVSSLAAFRKEKSLQKKYKVYQENGALITHFENVQECIELELDEEGTIISSLANVIRIDNPLIIVDEGHKVGSGLSIQTLKDLNPGFVIEYTATPLNESNILVNVSASELKDEQMVKIPIVLESSGHWENTLAQGLEKRMELEKSAKKIKDEYIRPIALIQAQSKSSVSATITVEQLKAALIERRIPEEEIAIKTSDKNELDGVDLFSKSCKIRYIITVNALAEGWDCSFAYVLISVANLGSKVAVEQIIGRVLRMPNAKRKDVEDFNRSYVFASARNFNEAADQIVSGLEQNGYSKADVIGLDKKSTPYELEAKKVVNDTLKVPMMAFEGDPLSFEDLIGDDFELAGRDPKFEFQIHYDNDGRAVIDIKENDEWSKSAQMSLKLTYLDKSLTKLELVQWLDKKLRMPILLQTDKVAFLDKVIEYQLKKYTLTELSVNRYVLADQLNVHINSIMQQFAKQRFDTLTKKSKITVESFKPFPNSITLKQSVPNEFNKNYYERIDKLNREELEFAQRLDLATLPNIKYWVRSREKIDPFYIQGWKKGKFYPDFVAVTKKGNILAIEWKGADRISNEDTIYKVELAKEWERLGAGKLHFFLAHTGNSEEVFKHIAAL